MAIEYGGREMTGNMSQAVVGQNVRWKSKVGSAEQSLTSR
jgi:hypothetical protein